MYITEFISANTTKRAGKKELRTRLSIAFYIHICYHNVLPRCGSGIGTLCIEMN